MQKIVLIKLLLIFFMNVCLHRNWVGNWSEDCTGAILKFFLSKVRPGNDVD